MKNIFRFYILIFSMSINLNPLLAQWVHTSDPVGGFVNTVAVNGSNIFVGTSNGSGLIRTTNNGGIWTVVNSGLDGQNVTTLAVIPNGTGGKNLLAGSGTVYLSTDNGANWVVSNTGMGWHGLSTIAVRMRGADSADLFAGGSGAVFLSTNNGSSWTEADSALRNQYIYNLSVNGVYIFAGTDSGVFRSTNNGRNWIRVNSGLPSNTIAYSFAISPNGSGGMNLLLGTCNHQIFLSSDSGASWINRSSGLPSSDYIRYIVVDTNISGETNLFAAVGYEGVYRSTNNGTSWSAVNAGLPISAFVNTLALSGTDLIAGTMEYGIYRSTNMGASWMVADGGLLVAPVDCMLMDGVNLFAGTCAGVYLSTNNSVSWTLASSGLPSMCVSALALSSSSGVKNLYAATSAGIYRSTDNGTNWTGSSSGLPAGSITSLAVNPNGSGGNTLFAGANGNGPWGVYRSTDNGNTWIIASSGLPSGADVLSLASGDGNVFASVYGGVEGLVYRSTDNGSTWIESDSQMNVSYYVNKFAFSTNDTGVKYVFAATDDGNVYRSGNSGASWTEADSGLPVRSGPATIIVAPTDSNHFAIFATGYAIQDGVFRSTNNGYTWAAVNDGFPYFPATSTLAVGPSSNGMGSEYLFAGSAFQEISGVWRRPLSDFGISPSYTILATVATNGSISPSGIVIADSGKNQQFMITPNTGYQVDSLIVDGAKVDSTVSYTFTNVISNHTIRASFKRSGSPISPWSYTNTGMNHTIIIDTSVYPTVNGTALDAGDFIGVFYDSSGTPACAGYGMWSGNGAITVAAFGNELTLPSKNGFATGEVFQWKIFRWQEDKVYNASATYYVPDSTNHLTNTNTYATNGISSLRSLTGGVQTENLALRKGWSIISSYVNPQSMVLDSLFNGVKTDLIILKDENGKAYIPSVPVNSVGLWNNTEGYQLKMDSLRNLSITGLNLVPELTPVYLTTGWSIIPYLRQSGMRVDSALTSIVHNVIIVKDQDGNAFIPSIPVNGIGSMEPGQGYQVKMTGLDTLLYPMNTFSFAKNIVEQRPLSGNTYKPHYQLKHISDNNATIAFPQKVVNGMLKKGDEVGVFSPNGLLVGCGMYEGESFAVAVWGDDPTTSEIDGLKVGESYNIRFWDRAGSFEDGVKNIQWSEGTSTYEVNGLSIAATIELEKPMMLLPDRVTLYQNYPNPFNPTTTVGFSIPKAMNVQIRIYNVLGELVIELANQQFETGYHELSFNSAAYPSGVYYCRIEANGVSDVKKMLFMK